MKQLVVRVSIGVLLLALGGLFVYRSAQLNTCPVCSERVEFAPWLHHEREVCTNCFALKRHRTLWLYLKHRTELLGSNKSVLHFSPNEGLERQFRKLDNLKYVTSQYEGKADINLDLTKLELPDQSWDVLIIMHVFEHIPDDAKAMREVYRVLKPGGYALIQVPWKEGAATHEDPSIVDPKERDKHFGQHDHVRYYGKDDFLARLRAAGLDVEVETLGDAIAAGDYEKYGISPDEPIVVATRPAK